MKDVPFIDRLVEADAGQVDRDPLRGNLGISQDAVGLGKGRLRQRMTHRLRLRQKVLGQFQSLDMIGVGVSNDQIFALRQRKIELADQIDDFAGRIFVANIDQQPFAAVMDQIHAAPQAPTRLVVHLDHMGK